MHNYLPYTYVQGMQVGDCVALAITRDITKKRSTLGYRALEHVMACAHMQTLFARGSRAGAMTCDLAEATAALITTPSTHICLASTKPTLALAPPLPYLHPYP